MDIKPVSLQRPISASSEMRDDITRMLNTMKQIHSANQAEVSVPANSKIAAPESVQFDQMLTQARQAVDQVNQLETVSNQMKQAYVSGDSSTSLTDVVLASQKSGLAFQALLSVRNKLLEAYRQIMDMPV